MKPGTSGHASPATHVAAQDSAIPCILGLTWTRLNALFKEFVLIEPLALTRWDVALEAYREASRLYEEFETARRRSQTLEPLPGIAEKYRAAGADYVAKNRLLAGEGDIADHPFQGWLARELNETTNYFCVEAEAELDGERPSWARGAITPAGMRTGARNRFTKDDRRLRYPWLGWDIRRLLQELNDELESLQRELKVADASADEASQRRESARARLDELRALRSELNWERIDTSAMHDRMRELETELAQSPSPGSATTWRCLSMSI